MAAEELFDGVFNDFKINYPYHKPGNEHKRFFTERDIVWTIQKGLINKINSDPKYKGYRVFNDFSTKKGNKERVDLAIFKRGEDPKEYKTVAKSMFLEVDLNGGTILDGLIKKCVYEEISATEVRLKRNEGTTIRRPPKIKGSNFDKIWDISQQRRYKPAFIAEFKYEPDHTRAVEFPENKFRRDDPDVVFWDIRKNHPTSVEKDIKRVRDYVEENEGTSGISIFIDEGKWFFNRTKVNKKYILKECTGESKSNILAWLNDNKYLIKNTKRDATLRKLTGVTDAEKMELEQEFPNNHAEIIAILERRFIGSCWEELGHLEDGAVLITEF
jgi:hypothetical protein